MHELYAIAKSAMNSFLQGNVRYLNPVGIDSKNGKEFKGINAHLNCPYLSLLFVTEHGNVPFSNER